MPVENTPPGPPAQGGRILPILRLADLEKIVAAMTPEQPAAVEAEDAKLLAHDPDEDEGFGRADENLDWIPVRLIEQGGNYFRGTIILTSDGGERAELPVELWPRDYEAAREKFFVPWPWPEIEPTRVTVRDGIGRLICDFSLADVGDRWIPVGTPVKPATESVSAQIESIRAEPPPPLRPLPALDAGDWEGQPIPPREWIVFNRVPCRTITILSGNGGTGKTTLALQLCVGVARGTDWLGAVVDKPGRVLFFSGEEEHDEIHRRLASILKHHNLSFCDIAGRLKMICIPSLDSDNSDALLAVPTRNDLIAPTDLYMRLLLTCRDIRPNLIVIESVADVFGGNENNRAQVRQFIGLLRHLAIDNNAGLMLLAHPSVAGMGSGSGTSGSTHWHNASRSRMYFSKVTGDDVPDDGLRLLEMKKNQHDKGGERLRLRWRDGVFVPEGGVGLFDKIAADAEAERVFLKLLDLLTGQGRAVSPNGSKSYAPALFAEHPDAEGRNKKDFASAMERLLAADRIHVASYGPPSRRYEKLVRTVRS